ncbi:hypothetical protein DFH94DRAFT_716786, partial [Russula ochroleuca]
MAPCCEDLASNNKTETDKNEYGFGIHLLDDLGERDLDILLTCPQELHQPRDELVVDPLPRKEVPAAFAEGDLQRVRLRRVAVPLEVFPPPALDLANRATCPVGLGGREQRLVPRLELSRELEVLVLRFLLLLLLLLLLRNRFLLHRHRHRHQHLHTPLNPNQLSVH